MSLGDCTRWDPNMIYICEFNSLSWSSDCAASLPKTQVNLAAFHLNGLLYKIVIKTSRENINIQLYLWGKCLEGIRTIQYFAYFYHFFCEEHYNIQHLPGIWFYVLSQFYNLPKVSRCIDENRLGSSGEITLHMMVILKAIH